MSTGGKLAPPIDPGKALSEGPESKDESTTHQHLVESRADALLIPAMYPPELAGGGDGYSLSKVKRRRETTDAVPGDLHHQNMVITSICCVCPRMIPSQSSGLPPFAWRVHDYHRVYLGLEKGREIHSKGTIEEMDGGASPMISS